MPFVDVVTTMLDASIPLTTNEYDEWGNPKDKALLRLHAVVLAVRQRRRRRPIRRCSCGTGLWDSQVQYCEPAKWVARLRATSTDTTRCCSAINMEAGHGGKSGRFRKYRELPEMYAFLLDALERPDSRTAAAAAP